MSKDHHLLTKCMQPLNHGFLMCIISLLIFLEGINPIPHSQDFIKLNVNHRLLVVNVYLQILHLAFNNDMSWHLCSNNTHVIFYFNWWLNFSFFLSSSLKCSYKVETLSKWCWENSSTCCCPLITIVFLCFRASNCPIAIPKTATFFSTCLNDSLKLKMFYNIIATCILMPLELKEGFYV